MVVKQCGTSPVISAPAYRVIRLPMTSSACISKRTTSYSTHRSSNPLSDGKASQYQTRFGKTNGINHPPQPPPNASKPPTAQPTASSTSPLQNKISPFSSSTATPVPATTGATKSQLFSALGCEIIIAADLLGYGDTNKPVSHHEYSMARIGGACNRDLRFRRRKGKYRRYHSRLGMRGVG